MSDKTLAVWVEFFPSGNKTRAIKSFFSLLRENKAAPDCFEYSSRNGEAVFPEQFFPSFRFDSDRKHPPPPRLAENDDDDKIDGGNTLCVRACVRTNERTKM